MAQPFRTGIDQECALRVDLTRSQLVSGTVAPGALRPVAVPNLNGRIGSICDDRLSIGVKSWREAFARRSSRCRRSARSRDVPLGG